MKEGAHGGTVLVIIISNIGRIRKLWTSGECDENLLICVLLMVSLCLSILLHTALEVLIAILAKRERQNAKLRKTLQNRTDNSNDGGIQDLQIDSGTSISDLRKREKRNDRINTAILVLTFVGVVLNLIINEAELR